MASKDQSIFLADPQTTATRKHIPQRELRINSGDPPKNKKEFVSSLDAKGKRICAALAGKAKKPT
jgi:hypothetical protein